MKSCESGATMSETRLGEIALLQVHSQQLVQGDEFDPAPLLRVDEASVNSAGMLGWTGSSWVVDVPLRQDAPAIRGGPAGRCR